MRQLPLEVTTAVCEDLRYHNRPCREGATPSILRLRATPHQTRATTLWSDVILSLVDPSDRSSPEQSPPSPSLSHHERRNTCHTHLRPSLTISGKLRWRHGAEKFEPGPDVNGQISAGLRRHHHFRIRHPLITLPMDPPPAADLCSECQWGLCQICAGLPGTAVHDHLHFLHRVLDQQRQQLLRQETATTALATQTDAGSEGSSQELERLTSELADARRELSLAESNIAELESEVTGRMAEIKRLTDLHGQLIRSNETLQKAQTQATEDRQQLESQLAEVSAARDEARRRATPDHIRVLVNRLTQSWFRFSADVYGVDLHAQANSPRASNSPTSPSAASPPAKRARITGSVVDVDESAAADDVGEETEDDDGRSTTSATRHLFGSDAGSEMSSSNPSESEAEAEAEDDRDDSGADADEPPPRSPQARRLAQTVATRPAFRRLPNYSPLMRVVWIVCTRRSFMEEILNAAVWQGHRSLTSYIPSRTANTLVGQAGRLQGELADSMAKALAPGVRFGLFPYTIRDPPPSRDRRLPPIVGLRFNPRTLGDRLDNLMTTIDNLAPWTRYTALMPTPISYNPADPAFVTFETARRRLCNQLRHFWYQTHMVPFMAIARAAADAGHPVTLTNQELHRHADRWGKVFSHRTGPVNSMWHALAGLLLNRRCDLSILLDPAVPFVDKCPRYFWVPDFSDSAPSYADQLREVDDRQPWRTYYTNSPSDHPAHRGGAIQFLTNRFASDETGASVLKFDQGKQWPPVEWHLPNEDDPIRRPITRADPVVEEWRRAADSTFSHALFSPPFEFDSIPTPSTGPTATPASPSSAPAPPASAPATARTDVLGPGTTGHLGPAASAASTPAGLPPSVPSDALPAPHPTPASTLPPAPAPSGGPGTASSA